MASGTVLDEIGTDDVPDFAFGLEPSLELVIAGERFLFEIEQVHGDAREICKGDVGKSSAIDGRDVVGAGFVRSWATGYDAYLIER
jgi:hypothetical protein